jgi:hypothetical protein
MLNDEIEKKKQWKKRHKKQHESTQINSPNLWSGLKK